MPRSCRCWRRCFASRAADRSDEAQHRNDRCTAAARALAHFNDAQATEALLRVMQEQKEELALRDCAFTSLRDQPASNCRTIQNAGTSSCTRGTAVPWRRMTAANHRSSTRPAGSRRIRTSVRRRSLPSRSPRMLPRRPGPATRRRRRPMQAQGRTRAPHRHRARPQRRRRAPRRPPVWDQCRHRSPRRPRHRRRRLPRCPRRAPVNYLHQRRRIPDEPRRGRSIEAVRVQGLTCLIASCAALRTTHRDGGFSFSSSGFAVFAPAPISPRATAAWRRTCHSESREAPPRGRAPLHRQQRRPCRAARRRLADGRVRTFERLSQRRHGRGRFRSQPAEAEGALQLSGFVRALHHRFQLGDALAFIRSGRLPTPRLQQQQCDQQQRAVHDDPLCPRGKRLFQKGSGTVAGTARRVLRTTVPDPF